MREIIVAWALCQPYGIEVDHCWWGMTTTIIYNRYGYGAKISRWGSGETHLALGRHGVIVTQFKILPALPKLP